MHDGLARKDHILGHGAVHVVLEAIEIVLLAHPVLAMRAEATVPAGDDLLGDDAIAHGDFMVLRGAWPQTDNTADELMPGDHRRLHIARLFVVSPERGRSPKRLDVAHADPARLHLCQHFLRARHGDRNVFQAIIAGVITDDGLHHRR